MADIIHNNHTDISMLVVNGDTQLGHNLCIDISDTCSHLFVIGKNLISHASDLRRLKGLHYESAPHDLSSPEAIEKRLRNLKKQIDAFLFVLPGMPETCLASLTTHEWQETINILREMFLYYRAVSRIMLSQGYGSMIGLCSEVSARGDENFLTAAIAGEAMIGMSKCLAQELLRNDIRVNTVCYGNMEEARYSKEWESKISEFIGVRRKANSSDLSALIKLLASRESSYITGQTIYVNGGSLM